MNKTATVTIPERPDVKTGKDWFYFVIGIIGAIKLLLAAPPFNIEIPAETIEAISNIVAWAFVGWGVYQKSYLTKKEKQQKSVIEQARLK